MKDGLRRRLSTSDESRTIVIEDSHSIGARREHAAQFTAGAIRADRWDLRALGTTLPALFWTSAVHAGAGSLLVSEAGGTLSDIDGRPWTIHSDSIIVSANPERHQELLDLAGAAGADTSDGQSP